ncbi:hypothetical protein HF313_18420 [Massilia atriviolacea]|uniref:Uncharacterized protein n=1 Tax=Massilia atriviolacea TaxID=2495579 RepID=A0A430HT88_9BURK|nr:hypothetical protein [Massilia atriviolacea]RSZ60741.1 hypothetical protein EJB06_00965 [Massilia atriviolacea]
MDENWLKQTPEGQCQLADIARRALAAFRNDSQEAYAQLVREYDNSSAVIGIFGLGSVILTVSGGEAAIAERAPDKPARLVGRAALYPETILALSEGRMTPIEAFHSGDLVVRAESDDLHRAYGLMVKYTDTALRSQQLQSVLKEFRALSLSATGGAHG